MLMSLFVGGLAAGLLLGPVPVRGIAASTSARERGAGAEPGGQMAGAPQLLVVSPQANDVWPIGTSQSFVWSSLDFTEDVRIEIATPGFMSPTTTITIAEKTANTGIYCWRVLGPSLQAGSYQVRVMPATQGAPAPAPAISGSFTLTAALQSLSVTGPSSNAIWPAGTDQVIGWSYSNMVGNLRIELQTISGSTTRTKVIFDDVPLSPPIKGWHVAATYSTLAQIKLSSVVDPFVSAVSPIFTILVSGTAPPVVAACEPCYRVRAMVADEQRLRIDSPILGERWVAGSMSRVNWTTNQLPPMGKVKLELSTNSGATFPIVVRPSTDNDLSYDWPVPAGAISGRCRLRISSIDVPTIQDVSDADFTIAPPGLPTLHLLVPDGGESYAAGSTQRLRWGFSGATGATVRIDFSSDSGNSFQPLASSVANNTDRIWIVPNVSATRCRIRIVSEQPNVGPFISDVSNCDFTVR